MIDLEAVAGKIATESEEFEESEFPQLILKGPFVKDPKKYHSDEYFIIEREMNLDDQLKQQLGITEENPAVVSIGIDVDFDVDTSEYGSFRRTETIAIINNYKPTTVQRFSLTEEDSRTIRNIIGDLYEHEESRISEKYLEILRTY